MTIYRDLTDAITHGGSWGPFAVNYPFSVIAGDSLLYGPKNDLMATKVNYLATRALTFTCEADVANAIVQGYLSYDNQMASTIP